MDEIQTNLQRNLRDLRLLKAEMLVKRTALNAALEQLEIDAQRLRWTMAMELGHTSHV